MANLIAPLIYKVGLYAAVVKAPVAKAALARKIGLGQSTMIDPTAAEPAPGDVRKDYHPGAEAGRARGPAARVVRDVAWTRLNDEAIRWAAPRDSGQVWVKGSGAARGL